MWAQRISSRAFYRVVPLFITVGTAGNVIYAQKEVSNNKDTLSVFIQPDNRKLIDNLLKKRGITTIASENPASVCIAQSLSEKDIFVYQPLLGERAAFRLKGLIYFKEGDIVGVGRVSTMTGELKHGQIDACIPLVVTGAINEMELLDAATRLTSSHVVGESKSLWKGRLPPGSVDGRNYYSGAPGMSFQRLPVDQQVVVGGTLCTNGYVDKDGNCTFDRSTIVPIDSVAAGKVTTTRNNSTDTTANTAIETTSTTSLSTAAANDDGETCPLCRYMKAGPCKSEFIAWNACISLTKTDEELQQCFPVTADMMRCMRAHEYYDVMAAGMDYTVVDSQEKVEQ